MTSPMLTCGFSLGTGSSNGKVILVANSRSGKRESVVGGCEKVTERRGGEGHLAGGHSTDWKSRLLISAMSAELSLMLGRPRTRITRTKGRGAKTIAASWWILVISPVLWATLV